MSAVEILRQTRELIADNSRWTKGVSARNSFGSPVAAISRDAVCWCLAGAVESLTEGEAFPADVDSFLDGAAFAVYGSTSFIEANDENPDGHLGILKVIDAAIEAAAAANA